MFSQPHDKASSTISSNLDPASQFTAQPLAANQEFLTLLGRNAAGEMDYYAEVEGLLPEGLVGTLYRNGPGMFERAGFHKRHLLDGDGFAQSFCFQPAKSSPTPVNQVRYRSRFVRTKKFLRETLENRFVHPTWTTLTEDYWRNLPGFPRLGQAGVTLYAREGRLLAFDEVGLPYLLDRQTLETLGCFDPSKADGNSSTLLEDGAAPLYNPSYDKGPRDYKAHCKFDGKTGDWVLLGWQPGIKHRIHIVIRDARGQVRQRLQVPSPRAAYVHDFFITERYVLVDLQPLELQPLAMLLGFKSFTESLVWRPEQGNLLLVIDREGRQPVRYFEAPAAFMWHSLNAYEEGETIIADFCGYQAPDHFIGQQALFASLMRGEQGQAQALGKLHRYKIDLARNQLTASQFGEGSYDFPSVHPKRVGYPHRFGYFSFGDGIMHDGLARWDYAHQCQEQFRFGPGFQVGEPIFVCHPDRPQTAEQEPGWLLSLVLSAASRRSFLAVFDAQNLAVGPVAKVHMQQHSPISFHGCWLPG